MTPNFTPDLPKTVAGLDFVAVFNAAHALTEILNAVAAIRYETVELNEQIATAQQAEEAVEQYLPRYQKSARAWADKQAAKAIELELSIKKDTEELEGLIQAAQADVAFITEHLTR